VALTGIVNFNFHPAVQSAALLDVVAAQEFGRPMPDDKDMIRITAFSARYSFTESARPTDKMKFWLALPSPSE